MNQISVPVNKRGGRWERSKFEPRRSTKENRRCPRNFTVINRTYDQDSDADLWRENNILFGKQTSRYLCLSKIEGLPDYVVETLKIISEKEHAPKEFSLLSRTADTEQKAWRKRQIAYKLSKRGSVSHAITDIIVCSKLKVAPEGFIMAGDINGILICYKTAPLPTRVPPPIPTAKLNLNDLQTAIDKISFHKKPDFKDSAITDHEYEEISAYQHAASPKRHTHIPPASLAGTLGAYSEIEGVPFMLNPNLSQNFTMPTLPTIPSTSDLNYDFQLERQILCTTKSDNSNLKNPFFR
ncbi:uncharacterized protein LOC119655454 isoform X2 [Hermetia illucens]|uniref:uncharacterized protein LOC119655454 isoform X2 n=1 Tax=Hermetia illucens TaxID=343691 RepID=UPI0018CC58FE|nr:uncharacterized protein LOC119655454 isoform X2 [Hermetia illucens]